MQTAACRQQSAGEQWVVPIWWTVNNGSGSVDPSAYVPFSSLAIEDFTAKLLAVEVVVDAGLPSQKRHYLAAADVLRIDIDTDALFPTVSTR